MIRRLLSAGYAGANRALHPFGLRLQKVTAPTRTFRDFFSHLRSLGIDFRTVIDVGVAQGTPAIYDAYPRAKYFLVEPLREFRGEIELLTRRLDATYISAAAGARNGDVEIHVHGDLSGSSTLRQVEGRTLDGTSRRVPLVRLDGLLPAAIDRPVLLKIDTQGAELEVLEGLGARAADMDVLIIEASLLLLREGNPQFIDLVTRLDALDFAVYDILEGHMRLLDGALAQVDLAFARKHGPLRSNPRFFSAQQLDRYVRGARKVQR